MIQRIVNLGSSSQGNCTLYRSGETRILVDAGLSARQVEYRLTEVGERIEQLSAVLLTHEHNDHCQGLKMLHKRLPELPVFANAETAEAILGHVFWDDKRWKIFRSGAHFKVGDVTVGSFRVAHSAAAAVGFHLYLDSLKCSHLTDLGVVPEETCKAMADSDVILIESNYDPGLMEAKADLRPFETHKRNFGRTGHLSNEESARALVRTHDLSGHVNGDWSASVGLLHLSRQFNSPELALSTHERVFGPLASTFRVTQESRPTVVYEA